MSPRLSKRAVRAQLYEICEHFVGEPRSSREDKTGKVRYTFVCPACGKSTFTAVLYPDADPPGSGQAGCSNKACAVPPKRDAPGVVGHFLGLSGKGWLDRALEGATEILRGDEALGPRPQELPFGEDEAPERTSGAPNGAPPAPPPQKSPAPPAFLSEQATPHFVAPGAPAAPEEDAALTAFQPTFADEPAERSPDRNPTGAELEAELDRRNRAYSHLLGLCPPGSNLFSALSDAGIGEDVIREAPFGHYRPEEDSAIVSRLTDRLGPVALASVPGFYPSPSASPSTEGSTAHSAAGSVRSSIGAEEAALIPYRDARGRVIAVEILPLEDAAGEMRPSRLLGGDPAGRDRSLGGTHHLWSSCPPAEIEALCDSLIEGMRAASAGVRCGALRGPESFCPPAGGTSLPELAGVEFINPRILYAPETSERSRTAAPVAATSTISRAGAQALVLGRPPYKENGLGTYLLALSQKVRRSSFESLFGAAHATEIHYERSAQAHARKKGMPAPSLGRGAAANKVGADTSEANGHKSGTHAPSTEPSGHPDGLPGASIGRRDAFVAQLERSPRKPSPDRAFTPREAGTGLTAALVSLALLFPVALFAIGTPMRLLLSAVAAAATSPPEKAGAHNSGVALPSEALFDALGTVSRALLGPFAAPLALLARLGASPLFTAALACLLCALIGYLAARRARAHRFRRIAYMEGSIQESPAAARRLKRRRSRAQRKTDRLRRRRLARTQEPTTYGTRPGLTHQKGAP